MVIINDLEKTLLIYVAECKCGPNNCKIIS